MDLAAQLRRDEGSKNFPYRDTVGKLTIGVGRNLDDRGLTDSEIEVLLQNDIANAASILKARLPWFQSLDAVRQAVLVNMTFNMGYGKLAAFEKMLSAAALGNFGEAANEMMNSTWAQQVGDRAIRLSMQMRSGEWQ